MERAQRGHGEGIKPCQSTAGTVMKAAGPGSYAPNWRISTRNSPRSGRGLAAGAGSLESPLVPERPRPSDHPLGAGDSPRFCRGRGLEDPRARVLPRKPAEFLMGSVPIFPRARGLLERARESRFSSLPINTLVIPF